MNSKEPRPTLLQENFPRDPWKVLVTSILLKKTRGIQVEKILEKFFNTYPTPEKIICADRSVIRQSIKPLGFWRRRSEEIRKAAEKFVEKGAPKTREDVLEFNGVGEYVADSYCVFILGELEIKSNDKKLIEYVRSIKNVL